MAEVQTVQVGKENNVLNGGEWELKQYGRLKGAGQSEETASWKIFEPSEESGRLTVTILNTGHFFISQEHTMLEGFSLISAQTWLKVLRKSDWLLFGSNAKLQKCRMFKVQFSGESKEKSMENCHSCIQKLQMYVDVQNSSLMESSERYTEGRMPINEIAQSVMNQQRKELDTSENPVLGSDELGMFIKLCLLDQHFPAFVESVEKELHKVAEN
ncbi:meiotic recombination protein REC114-like [Xenopus laevis]|uniref:Meiotic recombination protein REC114 n=2 Tax=Xenopus laevis TaxID=8355 RepID=A0A974DCS5_XENLA|nr:meiotic recombination protein REC114-like [Xenopus laevis]OCT89407.1 hypothetical protein XELAEV_18018028mg [Xenopus laevis]